MTYFCSEICSRHFLNMMEKKIVVTFKALNLHLKVTNRWMIGCYHANETVRTLLHIK